MPVKPVIALPGVFRPRSDTWLLAGALTDDGAVVGADVLDLCTGSGAVAVAAALAGAREVTAVDVSRRALLSARLNARRNRVRVRTVRGDLLAPLVGRRFDVIASNPPYLPSPSDGEPRRGASRAWEGGPDGRALLDRICADAPRHLRPGGRLLVVQSSVCDPALTAQRLRAEGLTVDVAARRHGPLGPLLSARAEMLESRGLLPPGSREEELVVVRAVAG